MRFNPGLVFSVSYKEHAIFLFLEHNAVFKIFTYLLIFSCTGYSLLFLVLELFLVAVSEATL